MFYLKTHSTHFIYGRIIVRETACKIIVRETVCKIIVRETVCKVIVRETVCKIIVRETVCNTVYVNGWFSQRVAVRTESKIHGEGRKEGNVIFNDDPPY